MADAVKSKVKRPRPLDILSGHRTHSLGGGILKAAPFKRNSFKQAIKPWNLCQVAACRKSTVSGERERDPSRRYCFRHLPENIAVFKAETEMGQLRHHLCTSDQKAIGCKSKLLPPQESCVLLGQRCAIPIDIDGQHSDGRCWVHREKIEHHYARTLRCLRYFYFTLKGNVQTSCTSLPYIRWHQKRVPFVYGVTKAPKGF